MPTWLVHPFASSTTTGASTRAFNQRDLDQTGFTLKAAAILLSRFQVRSCNVQHHDQQFKWQC